MRSSGLRSAVLATTESDRARTGVHANTPGFRPGVLLNVDVQFELVRVGPEPARVELCGALVVDPGFDHVRGKYPAIEKIFVVDFPAIERLIQGPGRCRRFRSRWWTPSARPASRCSKKHVVASQDQGHTPAPESRRLPRMKPQMLLRAVGPADYRPSRDYVHKPFNKGGRL